MTASSFYFLVALAADAGVLRTGEAPQLASMALVSVILAGLSIAGRCRPPAPGAAASRRPSVRPSHVTSSEPGPGYSGRGDEGKAARVVAGSMRPTTSATPIANATNTAAQEPSCPTSCVPA